MTKKFLFRELGQFFPLKLDQLHERKYVNLFNDNDVLDQPVLHHGWNIFRLD